jgi:carbon storage regulator
MLVLSRYIGEQFVINSPSGPIVVEVMDIRGHQVRVGIRAPEDVPIFRRELWDRMSDEERARKPKPRGRRWGYEEYREAGARARRGARHPIRVGVGPLALPWVARRRSRTNRTRTICRSSCWEN